jgi:hypothetical protein
MMASDEVAGRMVAELQEAVRNDTPSANLMIQLDCKYTIRGVLTLGDITRRLRRG